MAYELPGIEACDSPSSKQCGLVLDPTGNVVDETSGKVVLSGVSSAAASDSYSLFRIGDKFVLEFQNTSSSKNWAVLIFKYVNSIAAASDYMFLSQSAGPSGPSWKGQECRGDVALTQVSTPFEAAYSSLCGGKTNDVYIEADQNKAVAEARQAGLVVTIPVYESKRAVWSKASYVFVSNVLPDAGAMLCIAGCRRTQGTQRLGGWIDKGLWIHATLRTDESTGVVGNYVYLKNQMPIHVDGTIKQGGLNLKEYGVNRQSVASFVGHQYGDAYVGVWASSDGKKKYSFFLANDPYQ
jgi:hypothetical protein